MTPRSRDLMLVAGLIVGAAAALTPAAATAQGVTPVQYYQPEMAPNYRPPPPRYYQPPPPRRVCWTQNQRVFVGRDDWGRPVYRNVPRRVCGYR
ncbi:hypothetical protein GXW78_18715 [Roseomonas terrae]|uniref:Lectin-like protein BA14k n=1 Tax=Neoroseomonas terrae TaxID=424799 RepID=A0ABS5EL09_9PROT|nr:hypothetical protein [Neoroseomonas terrae]MBR0651709.1 hypothetical protein [Neoroseomonas terrae]